MPCIHDSDEGVHLEREENFKRYGLRLRSARIAEMAACYFAQVASGVKKPKLLAEEYDGTACSGQKVSINGAELAAKWLAYHQAEDEAARRKLEERQRKESLRAQAKSKLTPEERAALGLD